jgi:hypothetical protein
MPARFPTWMTVVLVIELLIALFLFALMWSHTASMSFGRTPPIRDLVFLAAPVLAVVLCGVLARLAWRKGQSGSAKMAVFMPFPLAIVVFGLLGAI